MQIQIENQTLAIKPCTHFFTRLLGMMFQKKKLTYGLYFPKCKSIHTFFMKQSIDILMVDRNGKVLAYYNNVKPWKIVTCKNAYACYEFSTGILKSVTIGTQITIL